MVVCAAAIAAPKHPLCRFEEQDCGGAQYKRRPY